MRKIATIDAGGREMKIYTIKIIYEYASGQQISNLNITANNTKDAINIAMGTLDHEAHIFRIVVFKHA